MSFSYLIQIVFECLIWFTIQIKTKQRNMYLCNNILLIICNAKNKYINKIVWSICWLRQIKYL